MQDAKPERPTLPRQIGLLALTATGICSMLGAAINVLPFMIQRNVPGIGPHVLTAYVIAAVPAVLAALVYAALGSAMPRAGGSYVYASRSLHPYLGFLASFSQWFGLSIAIGVVSFLIVPFLRDIAAALDLDALAAQLELGPVRVLVALALLWLFVGVNVRGLRWYSRTLVPLMFLMFAAGAVVVVAGFAHDHADFAAGLAARGEPPTPSQPAPTFDAQRVLAAATILFATFIGFDSIAQAGGEAKNPQRALPLAILIAFGVVGGFYLLFTAAVYHTVPWQFLADRAPIEDLTAPGLLGYVVAPHWTVVIVAGAAIALINDLPAMLLAVSRLVFAWAEDGVFPAWAARLHPVSHTPRAAIVLSGLVASAAILGSWLAGDFFLGVDILALSMLVNFTLMCVALLLLPRRNPAVAARIRFLRSRPTQLAVGALGALSLGALLVVHVAKDLRADVDGWYFRSTWVWLVVMLFATAVFARRWRALRRRGIDLRAHFQSLPDDSERP